MCRVFDSPAVFSLQMRKLKHNVNQSHMHNVAQEIIGGDKKIQVACHAIQL